MSATHIPHLVSIKPPLPFFVRVDTLMSALTRATLESMLPSPHIRETLESVRRFAESGRARKGVAERVIKSYGKSLSGNGLAIAGEALALEGREVSTLTRADAETLVRYTDADDGRALVFLDGLLYLSPELVHAAMSICGDRFDGRGRKVPRVAGVEPVARLVVRDVPLVMPVMRITESKGDTATTAALAAGMKPEALRDAVPPGAVETLMRSLKSKLFWKPAGKSV